MRNLLILQPKINNKDTPTIKFGMRTASDFYSKNKSTYADIINNNDIYPTDKMDIDPLLRLTSKQFIAGLQQGTPEEQALAKYLYFTRQYFDIWNSTNNELSILYPQQSSPSNRFTDLLSSNLTLEQLNSESNALIGVSQPALIPDNTNIQLDITNKITLLQENLKYFKTITMPPKSDIIHQMEESIASLQHFHQYLFQKYNYTLEHTSILSTLVVENFFSQIRSKIRYPNLYEFAYTMRRAKHEIIKQNSKDYILKMRQQRWKKYNNQQSVEFSMADIEFVDSAKRQRKCKAIYEMNAGMKRNKVKKHVE